MLNGREIPDWKKRKAIPLISSLGALGWELGAISGQNWAFKREILADTRHHAY